MTYGLEALDDTVKTPDDVTRRLGLTLLGLVPAVRGRRVPLLTEKMPQPFSEAFRALRTALVFTSGAESTRTIVVTSSQPLEGKTTTACNLASALALGGARVLLIDADLDGRSLHIRPMKVSNAARAVSPARRPDRDVREAIQPTEQPNLSIITAGAVPPNPSELLASGRMKELLGGLEAFDWVIIDTPPVLPVTDAVVLAQAVWGVVFVIGAESTRRPEVERALESPAREQPARHRCGSEPGGPVAQQVLLLAIRVRPGQLCWISRRSPRRRFRVRIRVARMSHVSACESHGPPE